MKEKTIQIEGLVFVIFEHTTEEVQQINEAKNSGRQLRGGYTFDIHSPHNPTGDYHIHLKDKNNEVLSMNKNGIAHDGYRGTRIPNKAFKALKQKLPDWNWPSNQILESLNYVYFLNKNSNDYLRPVKVHTHKDYSLNTVNSFFGFFHQFAEDPFLTGGSGGWKERTVALIETEDGNIKKVPVHCFQFLDIE